jgi:acid phosphatase
VILVVLENQAARAVLKSVRNGIFTSLAERYATLTAYDAVAHPSLPNYLALLSGSTQGLSRNCLDCVFGGPSLADTLATAGLTWTEYVEGLPKRAGDIDMMALKVRIPFLFFRTVTASPSDLARVVPLSRIDGDLASGRLATFSIVIPDLCHAMHDCGVASGDAWLATFIRPLLRSPAVHDAIVYVTFDESDRSDRQGGGGHVATLVLGPLVRRGASSATPVNHYSLLRAIEDSLGLPYLGRSASATPITGIWETR